MIVLKHIVVNVLLVIAAALLIAWLGEGTGTGFKVFWASIALAAIAWPIGRRGREFTRPDWRGITCASLGALVGAVVTWMSSYLGYLVFPAYWSAVFLAGVVVRYLPLWSGSVWAVLLAILSGLGVANVGRASQPMWIAAVVLLYVVTAGMTMLTLRILRRGPSPGGGSVWTIVAMMAVSVTLVMIILFVTWIPQLGRSPYCAYEVAFNDQPHGCDGTACWCGPHGGRR